MMEPIRLWRANIGHGELAWWFDPPSGNSTEYAALPRADFDALAAEAADARTLRTERDSLVKEREAANRNVIESLAIARKALEENDKAEAVLIDKAGVDGDDLAECCEALLAQRDAATARAERLAALLGEARGNVATSPFHKELLARIDAHFDAKREVPPDRIAALKDAIDANAEERNRFNAPTPDDPDESDRRGVDGEAIEAGGGGE